MNYVTLEPQFRISPADFVRFWKEQYVYPDMLLYTGSMMVETLEREHLLALFSWKNGMSLSTRKTAGFNNIASKLESINGLRRAFDETTFQANFKRLRPIWKIFLRHIIKPAEFPIFDQHVYRAYRYIHQIEFPETNAGKVEAIYLNEYIPFFDKLHIDSQGQPKKDVDDALWAFGKFLSAYPKMISRN